MAVYQRGISFKYMTDEQCAAIVDNMFRVLEEVGCEVLNADARALLEQSGCKVEGNICYIPREVLQKAIDSVPDEVTFYNRNGEEAFTIDQNCFYYGPHLGCPNTIDFETGESRPYVRADVANFARVSQALPHMTWSAAIGQINDLDPRVAQLYEAHDLMLNTDKAITTWVADSKMLDEVMEMCYTIAGGKEAFDEKPFMYIGMCPNNSLAHGDSELEPFLHAAKLGVPLLYTPGLMLGVQAPITLAGMASVILADTLVGLLLSQLVNPGTKFLAAAFIDEPDLTTLALAMTGPEGPMGIMMMADVFRYLGIPFVSHAGCSDRPRVDEQSASDAAISLYSAMLAGAGMTIHAGYVCGGMASSLEMLVIQDEIVSELRHIERGIVVDEDTLAFDDIEEIGPNGNYLEADSTALNMRSLWVPGIFRRIGEEKWDATGRLSCGEIAHERVREILAQGNTVPLPDDVVAKLDEILERGVKRILG